MSTPLQLRDIHLPPEPSWWPPAPGWWLLAVAVIALTIWLLRVLLRKRRARRRLAALDAEFEIAASIVHPLERVAAVSALLRRAARLRDPEAAMLQGEAWLHFLDRASMAPTAKSPQTASTVFSAGVGRVLLDGPYRASLDAETADALIVPARQCYRALVRTR